MIYKPCSICGNEFIKHKIYINKGKRVISKKCKVCYDDINAEKSRAYYERHKEERQEYARKYRKAHRSERNKLNRLYYIRNIDKVSLRHKLYYERKKR